MARTMSVDLSITMIAAVPSADLCLAQPFQDAGFEMTMGGRIGETIEFYYMDTGPAVHFVAESGSGHAIELTPVRQYPPQPGD